MDYELMSKEEGICLNNCVRIYDTSIAGKYIVKACRLEPNCDEDM